MLIIEDGNSTCTNRWDWQILIGWWVGKYLIGLGLILLGITRVGLINSMMLRTTIAQGKSSKNMWVSTFVLVKARLHKNMQSAMVYQFNHSISNHAINIYQTWRRVQWYQYYWFYPNNNIISISLAIWSHIRIVTQYHDPQNNREKTHEYGPCMSRLWVAKLCGSHKGQGIDSDTINWNQDCCLTHSLSLGCNRSKIKWPKY